VKVVPFSWKFLVDPADKNRPKKTQSFSFFVEAITLCNHFCSKNLCARAATRSIHVLEVVLLDKIIV
jgi:hypothetical protein